MEKFIVLGNYCEDAITKREKFRKEHLDRLQTLKDENILITLGPTKCTKYLFGIFNANNEKELRNLIEEKRYLDFFENISLDTGFVVYFKFINKIIYYYFQNRI